MRRASPFIVLAIMSAAAVVAGQGQQNQAAPPVFRAGANVVRVDVSVLDKERHPVRGLTAADFVVRENNLPQEIVSFGEVDVPDPVDPSTPWMRDVAPDVRAKISANDGRIVVIVLDDAQVRFDPQMAASVKEVGHRIVDQLGPNDLAAVVFTKDNRSAQDFTSDRARLLTAIDKFVPGFAPSTGRGDWGPQFFYEATLSTLDQIAEALAEADARRKALIYVSVGVPVSVSPPPGASTIGGGAGPGRNSAVAFGTSTVDSDPCGNAGTLRQQLDAIFLQAQRANVNVYSIDPSGLGGMDLEDTPFSPSAVGAASDGTSAAGLPAGVGDTRTLLQDFLTNISDQTGGFAIMNSNSFKDGIKQIFRENDSYYLVGYRTTNPAADGKLRKIEVKLLNHPDLTVRARTGYTAPKPITGLATTAPSVSLLKAAGAVIEKADLGMQVSVAPFAVVGQSKAAVAITLAMREPAPQGQTRVTENVDVIINAYDPEGKRKGADRLKAQLVLKASPNAQVQYEVFSRLNLEPGRYEIRLGAESALESKSGSVFYNLDIPDFAKLPLSLSGFVLSASPPVVSGGQQSVAFLPVVPTTRRQFESTDKVTGFLRVYQGGKKPVNPVTLAMRIVDTTGAAVYEHSQILDVAFFDGVSRSADYRPEVPMSKLVPGQYLLTIIAKSGQAPPVERDVRFTVR